MSKRGRPHRDILEDLESERKTLEVILLSWSMIEMHCTNAILRIYGISSQDPKSKPLINLRVSDKLRLLRRMELLSDPEFEAVQQFKRKRDSLFHRDGLFFPNYSESQKSQLIDMAILAADAGHDLSERLLKLPSPYLGKPIGVPQGRKP